MAEEAEQWVDGIELHQQVVEVWHCGDHVHFLDDVVQIQLRLHEPGLKEQEILVSKLALMFKCTRGNTVSGYIETLSWTQELDGFLFNKVQFGNNEAQYNVKNHCNKLC